MHLAYNTVTRLISIALLAIPLFIFTRCTLPENSEMNQGLQIVMIAGDSWSTSLSENELNIYMMNTDGTALKKLTSFSANYQNIAPHPTDAIICFAANIDSGQLIGYYHNIFIIDILTEQMTALTSTPNNNNVAPVFSPYGSEIFYLSTYGSGNYRIFRTDVETPSSVPVTEIDEMHWKIFDVSPLGTHIIYNKRISEYDPVYTTHVIIRDLETGIAQDLMPDSSGIYVALSFNHDGSKIYYRRDRPGIASALYRMDLDGSNTEQVSEYYDMVGFENLHFTFDGNSFLYLYSDGYVNQPDIYLSSTLGFQTTQLTNVPGNHTTFLSVANDDDLLAYSTRDGSGYNIYITRISDNHPAKITNTFVYNHYPIFLSGM